MFVNYLSLCLIICKDYCTLSNNGEHRQLLMCQYCDLLIEYYKKTLTLGNMEVA